MDMFLNILKVVAGFVLLIKGADFFVDGASALAKKMKIPTLIIGLTIVAFGTSLPELITSITAAKKGQADIAIGNIVGSNVFNILFVLGTTSLIHDVPYPNSFLLDTIVALVSAVLLFVCVVTYVQFLVGKKRVHYQ